MSASSDAVDAARPDDRAIGESPRSPAGPADVERTTARRVQLFVNPDAGSWRHRRIAALVTAFEAAGATVIVTESANGRAAIAHDVDHVCAVGGDGTARAVAAMIGRVRPPPAMSVYPLGTVNLLARECGYSSEPAAFVRRAMVRPAPRRHHVGSIDGTPLLTCASVGPDSYAVDSFSPRLKRLIGRAAYGVAFCRLLGRWPRHRLRVRSGDRDIACEAVYVAKGRFFAGRWSVAPEAAVDAPLLHVVALEHASRLAFLRFAWALLRGREPRGVIRFSCTSLAISGDDGVPVQADGDIVAGLPVRIRIAPDRLAFS